MMKSRSLYYKSLNKHMGKFRKESNLQLLNDELHNLNLKEELNKDNILLNNAAQKFRTAEAKQRLEAQLNPNKELKEYRKAEKAIKSEALKETVRDKLNIGTKSYKVLDDSDYAILGDTSASKAKLIPLIRKYGLKTGLADIQNKQSLKTAIRKELTEKRYKL